MRFHRTAALATLALPAALAPAQQAVTIPSGGYKDAAKNLLPHGVGLENSEEVILPAIAAMDAPPSAIATVTDALLMSPRDRVWPEATTWAQATPQRKALEALATVTDPKVGHAFALPYGEEETAEVIVKTGLYNEILQGDLLATVDHVYLRGLDDLFILASVEAERRAEAGDASAPQPLVQWVLLARQVADQAFYHEKLWAMRSMRLGLERLRDLIYYHPRLLSEQQMIDLLREFDPRALVIDRIAAPTADRLAAQQLVAETYVERRGPDPRKFPSTLAELSAGERPLRLFGEAGYFSQVASTQADYYEVIDTIDDVFGDWTLRWDLPPTDLILEQATHYTKLDPAKYSLLAGFTPNFAPLFAERMSLRTEIIGTRCALGAVGYWVSQRVWPPDLPALRPRYFTTLDNDPFDPSADRDRFNPPGPLRYFVPVRDQRKGPRDQPGPHTVALYAAGAELEPAGHTDPGSASDPPPPDAAMLTQIAIAQVQGSLGAIPPAELRSAIKRTLDFLQSYRITPDSLQERLDRLDEEDLRRWQGEHDIEIFRRRIEGETVDPAAPAPPNDMDADSRRAAIAAYLERILADPTFVSILEQYGRGGQDITDEAARTAFLAMIEPDLRAQAEALAPTLIKSDIGKQEFKVNLDDSTFVLYSVGPNGSPDWARAVGPGGSDVLLWPPVLSLLRADINGTDPLAPWKK